MNYVGLVALAVVLLAAVAHASLQVSTGSLLLLFHASLGKHIKKRTREIAANYVSGVYIFIALMLAAVCFVIGVCLETGLSSLALVVGACVLGVLAVLLWFFYYRFGKTTELWIPRSVARYIDNRARRTESNLEAFSLGLLTAFAEMPFALVLIILAGNSISVLPVYIQPFVVLLYAIVATVPLSVMRFAVKNGKTVVDIQKWRVKNKLFLQVISGVLFATLAIFVVVFEVMK